MMIAVSSLPFNFSLYCFISSAIAQTWNQIIWTLFNSLNQWDLYILYCDLDFSDEHGEPDLDDIDEEDEDDLLDEDQMDMVDQAPPSVPIPAPIEPPIKRKRGRPPKNAPKLSPTKSITKTTTGNVCSS